MWKELRRDITKILIVLSGIGIAYLVDGDWYANFLIGYGTAILQYFLMTWYDNYYNE